MPLFIINHMKEILISDSQYVVRLGLKILAEEVLGSCSVELTDVSDELLLLLKAKNYDLLIADLNIPKGDELMYVTRILQVQPNLKILAVSASPENIFAERYLKAGVYGYVEKSNTNEGFKNAIRVISEGKRYISPEFTQQLLGKYAGESAAANNPFERLTRREFEVTMLILRGMSTNEASYALDIHTSTISTYKKRIFEKLKVANIVGLANLASNYHISASS